MTARIRIAGMTASIGGQVIDDFIDLRRRWVFLEKQLHGVGRRLQKKTASRRFSPRQGRGMYPVRLGPTRACSRASTLRSRSVV